MGGRVTILDPSQHSPEVREFENALLERLVGQDRAVRRMARVYHVNLVDLVTPSRPLVRVVFHGAMGLGQHRLVEAVAEVDVGDAVRKADTDGVEFLHGYE